MKDVLEVLRVKEQQLQRVRQEVEALRLTVPFLEDEDEEDSDASTSAMEPPNVVHFP